MSRGKHFTSKTRAIDRLNPESKWGQKLHSKLNTIRRFSLACFFCGYAFAPTVVHAGRGVEKNDNYALVLPFVLLLKAARGNLGNLESRVLRHLRMRKARSCKVQILKRAWITRDISRIREGTIVKTSPVTPYFYYKNGNYIIRGRFRWNLNKFSEADFFLISILR